MTNESILKRSAVGRAIEEVEIEAGEWGVPARLARALLVLPFLGGALVLAIRAKWTVFDWVTREDSLLEWTQFAGYAVAAILGATIAWRFHAAGQKWVARAYLAFTVAMVFIAGEEISWGQRIFGWGAPAALENKQHETTIHNTAHVLKLFNWAMLLVGLCGFVAPWLLRSRRVDAWMKALVPPLFLTTWFFFLFGYKFARLTAFTQTQLTSRRYGEWAELCLAVALAIFTFLVLRRRTPGGRGESSTSS
ncbi:MAG TPA: hypothetical protein VH816_15685 [Gaiellaceae bacterium]|jgi:hypothetical protein